MPQVLTAEKRLEACLLNNDELLTTLRQLSHHTDAQDLCGDIRELFKYCHIDLRNEACIRLENASRMKRYRRRQAVKSRGMKQ